MKYAGWAYWIGQGVPSALPSLSWRAVWSHSDDDVASHLWQVGYPPEGLVNNGDHGYFLPAGASATVC